MRHLAVVSTAVLFISASAAPASLLLNEDFSTYGDGNLVGQNGWIQEAASSTLPIQVTGGQVVIPGLNTGGGDNQDASKAFSSVVTPPAVGTTSVYVGLDLTVTSAATNPSYFFAMAQDSADFDNARVTARANAGGGFDFGARVTGQGGHPFSYGTTGLSLNTPYTLVLRFDLVSDVTNDAITAWVDPLSELQPAYFTAGGSATDPLGYGIAILSQFSSATVGQDGVNIKAIRVATTFGEVVPEPGTLSLLVVGAIALSRRRR